MNIIDAWKSAKEGQRIKSASTFSLGVTKTDSGNTLHRVIVACCGDEGVMADDWEVVKEKKAINCALVEILGFPPMHLAMPFPARLFGQDVPLKARVTIEWEE